MPRRRTRGQRTSEIRTVKKCCLNALSHFSNCNADAMLPLGVQLVPNLSPTYQNPGATAIASCVLAKAHNDAELDVSHSCLSGLPSLLFPSLLNRHNLPRFPIRAKPEEFDGLQVNR